jgi:hypothetical protein
MTDIRVGLDVDGVVADIYPSILRAAGVDPSELRTYRVGDSYGPEVAERVHAEFQRPEHYVAATTTPDATWSMMALNDAGIRPVFITASPARFLALRIWWLQQKFGADSFAACVYAPTSKKADRALAMGITHFVEDRPDTAAAMARAGIESILVPTPYSGEPAPGVRLETLSDFVERITA